VSALIINHFHINKTRVKWRAIITVIVITIRTTKTAILELHSTGITLAYYAV